jgi:hypothetical protein
MEKTNMPPPLKIDSSGKADNSSLADLLEWFLNYDEKTARIRHPHTNELFQWKQADDQANGVATYPFENAEARFAIGSIQAVNENNSEPLLKLWITDVLNALHESRETRTEMSNAYRLDDEMDASPLNKANKLTTNSEKRLYLTSCWLETLCTAEARFLGWVYQEMYGRPFAP